MFSIFLLDGPLNFSFLTKLYRAEYHSKELLNDSDCPSNSIFFFRIKGRMTRKAEPHSKYLSSAWFTWTHTSFRVKGLYVRNIGIRFHKSECAAGEIAQTRLRIRITIFMFVPYATPEQEFLYWVLTCC